MKIALDAMGGDNAPAIEVEGAVLAAKEFGIEVILVGDKPGIEAELEKYKTKGLAISVVHASEVIGMHESPTDAYKQKKDSSLVVGVKLVKDKKADALISAGNTGAVMATALFELGRLKGVARPALGAFFPSKHGRALLLDAGANADCKPKHLQQFAIMGAVYYNDVITAGSPRVGLISIGEEETKGNDLTIEAAKLIKATNVKFIGNIEGRDILSDKADVIICDGFVGNVVLKFAESLAKNFFAILKAELSGKSIFISIGAWILKPVFKGIIKKTDYAEYGCAPLLGINGYIFVSHGSSNVKAMKNAFKTAVESVQSNVQDHIAEEIKKFSNGETE
ncbi:MAG: phosphate acyltransferase [Candidatus Firestonebacteria bacterium RIFOXYC2_FULL_39_67]|nr:MAG: phosphate acyltransferase [Candidatus Firestonebacteria bacterium RIFOXYD2_FULL_39_29]OGF53757.1 MAG: phosphate acyltransferase [Candidatus Firestonebacteria bacterium RIFOXYC2_FULL_39_67]OGF57999.1 MAG: phosphate acyltransferase [Candidatus Firestonebacteria bacterium RifOxyC12_full_39_7]